LAGHNGSNAPGDGNIVSGHLIRVIDGDTLRISSSDRRIRLWGKIISCIHGRGATQVV
jgi:hypothetical protein